MQKLPLPISVEVKTCLGPNGDQFEIRVTLSNNLPGVPSSTSNNASSSFAASSRSTGLSGGRGSAGGSMGGLGARFAAGGGTNPFSSSSSTNPTFGNILVSIPVPTANVRTVTDLYPSRGDASYVPTEGVIEWRIPSSSSTATGGGGGGGTISGVLKGTVIGMISPGDDEHDNRDEEEDMPPSTNTYSYDEGDIPTETQIDSSTEKNARSSRPKRGGNSDDPKNDNDNKKGGSENEDKRKKTMMMTMPLSVQLSFQIKGWLASGLKIESLNIQHRSSRGVGEGVRPYKGVKYLTVAEKGGWEYRC